MNYKLIKKQVLELDSEKRSQLLQELEQIEESEIESMAGIRAQPTISLAGEFWEKAKELRRSGGKPAYLSSGLYSLDVINGGYDRQELVIVTGETGMGKTNLTMNSLANMAAAGNPVLFFTLEMSLVEVTQRFQGLTGEAGKDYPIYYWAGKEDVSVAVLRQTIEYAVRELGVKLVAIDHLHYFSRSTENQGAELGIITMAIKKMARDFDIPVILVCHTRKLVGAQERPYLNDIKDTSAVAQDADQVIIVWRNLRSSDPQERYTLRFEVAKNRLKGKCDQGFFHITSSYKLIENGEYQLGLAKEAFRR